MYSTISSFLLYPTPSVYRHSLKNKDNRIFLNKTQYIQYTYTLIIDEPLSSNPFEVVEEKMSEDTERWCDDTDNTD